MKLSLWRQFGLLPLEFDGLQESLYHPFDASGPSHTAYANQRGAFDDMPQARIAAEFGAT